MEADEQVLAMFGKGTWTETALSNETGLPLTVVHRVLLDAEERGEITKHYIGYVYWGPDCLPDRVSQTKEL